MACAAVVVCSVCHVAASYYSPADERSATATEQIRSTRFVLWNVGRGTFGWSELPQQIASFDADVICLVESKRLDEKRTELQLLLPAHTIEFLSGGFTVISRAKPIRTEVLAPPNGRAIRVWIPGGRAGELQLILVDFLSNPFLSRGPDLAFLREALRSESSTILLGDFNTPRTSYLFDSLRTTHVHAFEAAGHGFVETWPAPLPVLDLDHIWCDRRLTPLRCHHEFMSSSDHRAVILDLARIPR